MTPNGVDFSFLSFSFGSFISVTPRCSASCNHLGYVCCMTKLSVVMPLVGSAMFGTGSISFSTPPPLQFRRLCHSQALLICGHHHISLQKQFIFQQTSSISLCKAVNYCSSRCMQADRPHCNMIQHLMRRLRHEESSVMRRPGKASTRR